MASKPEQIKRITPASVILPIARRAGESKIRQDELARDAEISTIEGGRRVPRIDTAIKITRSLERLIDLNSNEASVLTNILISPKIIENPNEVPVTFLETLNYLKRYLFSEENFLLESSNLIEIKDSLENKDLPKSIIIEITDLKKGYEEKVSELIKVCNRIGINVQLNIYN